MGKALYKFREFNNNSIQALINDELWGTTPKQFNDPYDSIFLCDYSELYNLLINDPDCMNLLIEETKIIYEKEGLNSITVEDDLKNKNDFLPQIQNYFLDALDFIRKQFLITCFCETKDNEYMWSNYANYGEGFALEYDENDLKKLLNEYIEKNINNCEYNYSNVTSLFEIKKVEYSNEKYDGTIFTFKQIKQLLNIYKLNRNNSEYNIKKSIKNIIIESGEFKQIFLHKKLSWEHEKEFRLILPKQNLNITFGKLGKIKPKAIYMGEFISLNNEIEICLIAKNKNIPIYKMYSSLNTKNGGLKAKKLSDSDISNVINSLKKFNPYN